MATYHECDKETIDLAGAIIDARHPHLKTAEVTVFYRFAYAKRDENGMATGPALKLHGYPCAATVKINSYANRQEGLADATVTIDGDEWPHTAQERRRAILDHELTHLEVVWEDEGKVPKTDDAGRPKLRMKLHDLVVGGFESVIKEHGAAAVEAQHIKDVFKNPMVQATFPWG